MTNAIRIRLPAKLDSLTPATVELRSPGRNEVLVRVRASSINYHDYAVVSGHLKPDEGRIPLSDGAGEVIAVGDEATTPFSVPVPALPTHPKPAGASRRSFAYTQLHPDTVIDGEYRSCETEFPHPR